MSTRWVPFAYGFRPFFLLAGVFAAVAMVVWLWAYSTGSSAFGSLPSQLWHSHEMLFGFVGAAIAVRVFGPALLPIAYTNIVLVAGSLWVLAFLLFAVVYVPILIGARVDGKSG